MIEKYICLLILIIDLGLSTSFAADKKKEATLDDIRQDSVPGALILQNLTTGENFNDDKLYSQVPGTPAYVIPEQNLPKVRTQDGTPLCQTFCPTLLAEFQYCKQKEITNCRDLPDTERFSPISTLMYRDNVDNDVKSSIGSLSTSGNRNTYEVMNSISSASEQTFFSESCAPFDQFVKNFDSDPTKIEEFRLQMKSKFEHIRVKLKTTEATASSCPECLELLSSINKGFNSKTAFNGLAKALKSKDFKEFLYLFLFEQQLKANKSCKELAIEKRIMANYFPRSWEPYSSVEQVFGQAKEQLKKNNPVALSSICMAKSKAKGDCSTHCMVLTGMKTVKNEKTGELIEIIRVQNSWDQSWQDNNSGGWLRADNLKSLVRTVDDQTISHPHSERKDAYRFTISWFE